MIIKCILLVFHSPYENAWSKLQNRTAPTGKIDQHLQKHQIEIVEN
jgi:hypothetical protein